MIITHYDLLLGIVYNSSIHGVLFYYLFFSRSVQHKLECTGVPV